jgi:type II secretory pathway predicted ATPase ExeA
MYYTHWGLRSAPFGGPAGEVATQTESNPAFDEALARLNYLVEQQGRLGLLLGAPGTGKTSVAQRFVARLRRQGVPAALLGGRGCTEPAFLQQLARAWQLPRALDEAGRAWELLDVQMAEWHYEQQAVVLVLDDADRASVAVRQQIEQLLHLAATNQTRLTTFLAGSPEQVTHMGASLLEQVELRIDLLPWNEDETAEHVARTIFQSGGEHPIFTDDAITALHELSGGIPRKVDQIAQLALLAGAGQGLEEIDAATLVEAYQELGTGSL